MDLLSILSEAMDQTLSALSEDDLSWPEPGSLFWTFDSGDGQIWWDIFDEKDHATLRAEHMCYRTEDEVRAGVEEYIAAHRPVRRRNRIQF